MTINLYEKGVSCAIIPVQNGSSQWNDDSEELHEEASGPHPMDEIVAGQDSGNYAPLLRSGSGGRSIWAEGREEHDR
jgi:hypothetical protein